MLFGGKFKLTQRVLAVPDHLGSFFPVTGPESRDRGGGSGTDSGEEMETFLSDGPGSINRGRERDGCAIPGVHVAGELFDDEDEFRLWEEDTRQDCKKVNDRAAVAPSADADESGPELESELYQTVINLEALQKIASRGLPPGGGFRALVWKVLLGYLPGNRDLWEGVLAEKRAAYVKLKSELILNPSRSMSSEEYPLPSTTQDGQSVIDGQLKRHEIPSGDHPLSLVKASVWHQYFQDSDITAQIDRDIQRTHPNMRFFAGESTFSLRNRTNAEADSFFCFVTLLSDSVDHFCPQLDNSPMGIFSTLSDLSELLKANDEELWRHLEVSNKVKPQFYAFRWITLLLTQEFDFHAILRIWDSLLSSPFGVQEMLLRVCCAMLVCVRGELLDGDFAANLKLLQHYPRVVQPEHLLRVARDEVVVTPERGLRGRSRGAILQWPPFCSPTIWN